jgi:hypothetical protein
MTKQDLEKEFEEKFTPHYLSCGGRCDCDDKEEHDLKRSAINRKAKELLLSSITRVLESVKERVEKLPEPISVIPCDNGDHLDKNDVVALLQESIEEFKQ